MRKILSRLPNDAILPFIVADEKSGVLKIRFDDLCDFLIKQHNRSFSVVPFEKKIQQEVKKLINKPMTKKNLSALCRYIDDLGIYMSNVKAKTFEGDIPKQALKEYTLNHQAEYDKALQKAKERNPEEYEILRKKIDSRLG